MKQKTTALILAFCLFSTIAMGNVMADFEGIKEKRMINEDSTISGGPADIMPPQLDVMPLR